ncbi:hypothetical protein RIF29_29725 [Crotalaria pallida]|uniref:NAD-dependent epimerase/dehydratase domain-containing protein n=1 Tax=Crotalaria pallida TaxID=3830 RepID=A0AAN9HWH1_CROPI
MSILLKFSKSLTDAVLLVKEPQHRLAYRRGATEIKQHPFFQNFNWALIRCANPPEVPRPVAMRAAPTEKDPLGVKPSGSVKLAKNYMKKEAMELQAKSTLEKDPVMDYMLLQGVRFSFRIHQRVVFTSSIGAVYTDPSRSIDVVVDESCWSDLEFCKNTKNWYCYGKAVAEEAAWDEAKKRGVDLVSMNPVLVLGPLLQPTLNASTIHVLKYLTGSAKTYVNVTQAYVDVRDVALAHILVYENPSASGRYIIAESSLHRGELVEVLAKYFPEYPVPTK